MIKLVLFDIDGTLIRTGGAGVKAFGKAFETEFDLRDATKGVTFCGRTDTGILRECFSRHGLPWTPENKQRFFDAYVFWLSHCLYELHGAPCEGVLPFLESLAKLPSKPVLGLLTGNIRLGAEIKLRHYQLWDWFDVGAFADEHEDRNQIAILAHELGSKHLKVPLRGEEILVIGDTPHDITCGKAINARVLAVGTGNFTPAQLQTHKPDWAVPDLRHCCAAEVCGVR